MLCGGNTISLHTIFISFFSFCFLHCSVDNCYQNYYLNITDYQIDSNLETPNRNIPVYSNSDIDLELIDYIIDWTEDCLNMELNQECFQVYVPDDWYVSPCSGEQLFPCNIVDANGYNICQVDKGLEPTEQCPCNCRATIQDENVIITTPNLKLFGMSLVRMITGLNNPYAQDWTRECVYLE